MTHPKKALLLASLLTGFGLLPAFAAEETTVNGKLTITEEDALYGVAILRDQPDQAGKTVGHLVPGARVTVFPETSPKGWWYIEVTARDGGIQTGFVPRSTVKVAPPGPFKDVADEHWASGAIRRLKDGGYLTGYNGTDTFAGEKPLSRYEMAVMVDRYMSRLQASRAKIEEMIAKIPLQKNLGPADAAQLDELVQRLDGLAGEEKDLRRMVGELDQKVAAQGTRIDELGAQVAGNAEHEADQDRRIDELARTGSQVASELAAIKAMREGTAAVAADETANGTNLAAGLAVNIVKVKDLYKRIEGLEAKVTALEARDKLAKLLLDKGEPRIIPLPGAAGVGGAQAHARPEAAPAVAPIESAAVPDTTKPTKLMAAEIDALRAKGVGL